MLCHGGVVRMLLAILLDLPLPRMSAFEVDYASLTVVEQHRRGAEIQLLNFTPWRRSW
jgi:broad specificity phosphatase PhoE